MFYVLINESFPVFLKKIEMLVRTCQGHWHWAHFLIRFSQRKTLVIRLANVSERLDVIMKVKIQHLLKHLIVFKVSWG